MKPKRMDSAGMAALHLGNAATCYAHLQQHAPASITDISQATKLTRPTIAAALKTLQSFQLVSEASKPSERFGRPARLYELNSDSPKVLAITEERDHRRLLLGRLNGDVISSISIKRTEEMNTVASLKLSIEEFLSSKGVSSTEIRAVGVAISGTVNNQGKILRSTRCPYLEGNELSVELSEMFPLVAIENDANLAACSEGTWGSARDKNTVIYVSVGNRIVTGIYSNGTIVRGSFFNAGEIADFMDNTFFPAFLPSTVDQNPSETQAPILEGVAAMTAMICRVIDPDAVVLAGQLMESSPELLTALTQTLKRASNPNSHPTITTPVFAADVALAGAFIVALDKALQDIFCQRVMVAPISDIDSVRSTHASDS